jgi:hypothetical protein
MRPTGKNVRRESAAGAPMHIPISRCVSHLDRVLSTCYPLLQCPSPIFHEIQVFMWRRTSCVPKFDICEAMRPILCARAMRISNTIMCALMRVVADAGAF